VTDTQPRLLGIVRRRWRLVVRLALLLVLAGVLALGSLAALILVYGEWDQARPADVIVVLGGGRVGTERRAYHAAALYHAGYAPTVICTGAVPYGWHTSEAARCARAVMREGVPADAILLEEVSRSTEENAIESAALIAAHGWDSAVIVSDDYHLWRANLLFEAQGITAWPSPAQKSNGPLPPREKTWSTLREVAATVWYAGKTVLGLPYTRVGR